MVPVSVLLLVVLAAIGLPIAVVLAVIGVTLSEVFAFFPLLPATGEVLWTASTQFVLVAVPLFILMGELLLRAGIANEMYEGVDAWVSRIPGGLMHTNIASSALFASTSGSSVATAATIGTISIPNMTRYGYSPPLYLGSVAAGGTLGILIPPSINMILYGVLADVPIPKLYVAGLIPGLLLAALFSLVVFGLCLWRPGLSGPPRPVDWRRRWRAFRAVAAPLALFLIVVGSIYAGWATPTEAAALGVIAALGLTHMRGRLSVRMLRDAFENTMRTTCMVMLIVTSAFFLNFMMSAVGLTGQVTGLIQDLNLSPLTVMLLIIAGYLLLGCFMESLSLMVATTPIVVPVVVALGYDPVWFGVLFMILIEAALITPPIGVNLFVVQTVRGAGPFRDVMVGSVPFLVMMVVMMMLLLAAPELALWLPTVLAR